MSRISVEISADSIESAIAADHAGADRIELCGTLDDGGVTPSAGLIATVVNKVSLGVFVLIRPRAGDFLYSPEEFKVMERDILMAKQLGADGVVFGILNQEGRVDLAGTQRLVEIARPLKITFHRAFDMSRNLSESIEDLVRAGVDRVLTSGGEQTADLGKTAIAQLTRRAGGRLMIMAGSGINEHNAPSLVAATGVREIHASLRSPVPSPMLHRNEKISFGDIKGREYERSIALEDRIRALIAAVSQLSSDDTHA